jgi:hypothetical protein
MEESNEENCRNSSYRYNVNWHVVFSACKSKETQEQLPDTTAVEDTSMVPMADTTHSSCS